MNTFTQIASGSFEFRTVQGTPHCGVVQDGKPLTLNYLVTVDYPETALDENGFLLDNTWFRDYFANYVGTRISISCERLAVVIAQHICEAIGDRECNRVHVSLTVPKLATVQYVRDGNADIANQRQNLYAIGRV